MGKSRQFHLSSQIILLCLVFLFSSISVFANDSTKTNTKKKEGRKGVPVLVFHRIGKHWGEYRLSVKEFSRILAALKNNNFCPVSLDEIMSNSFRKECWGKKLFCITFDDAHASQLRFLKDGSLDSTCMVGVLLKYFEDPRAAFFINTDSKGTPPWGKDSRAKMEFLTSRGMTIGNHTARHKRLDLLSVKEMNKELGDVFKYAGLDSMFISYPYGVVLKNEKQFSEGFKYEGHPYFVKAAFTGYEEIDAIETIWDRLQMIRYLCPLGDTEEFERRRYELPRLNITSFDGFYLNVIKNPNVLMLDSVRYSFTSDSALIRPILSFK